MGPQPSMRISASNSDLKNRFEGRPRRLDADGPVAVPVNLTNKIIGTMKERTHLQENEVHLMISLLKVYAKAVQQKHPQQSRCDEVADIFVEEAAGILDLNSREILPLSEERLLGQLAVIVFRNTNDAEHISLPNFPRSMPIQITRLPHQRKLGDEEQNRSLYSARITPGKTWLNCLP